MYCLAYSYDVRQANGRYATRRGLGRTLPSILLMMRPLMTLLLLLRLAL